jgi:hypothetical protein
VRLQSHVWVSAFLRAETAAGGFPAVIRKGSPEAGAIFVLHEHSDGSVTVYGPAPQASVDAETASGRSFERVLEGVTRERALEWLDRQVRFDSDCWILGTESRGAVPALVSQD